MREENISAYARYLPVENNSIRWGMHIIDCGFTDIGPGIIYPPNPHPEEYVFSWENGRTLKEYQLVYISKGSGSFESESTGLIEINQGDVFFLYPDIWHRYKPDKEKGWDENWIGFNGEYAKQLMSNFFQPAKPVVRVGQNLDLLHQIRSITKILQNSPAGYQQLMAARAVEVLARIRSLSMSYNPLSRKDSSRVQQARAFLLEHSAEDIDVHRLAEMLGLSYSRFRKIFKEHTGSAPQQYLIEARLNKACELLTQSELKINSIAKRTGFATQYYFSRLFKERAGCSPLEYRKRNKGNQQPASYRNK